MFKKRSLTLPGRYAEIRRLCEFVGAGAREAGLDDDAVFQVQLACDEACTNIIEHTYGAENRGNINVKWRIEEAAFTVTIEDNGKRFDPEDIPPPPVPPPAGDPDEEFDVKVGGLGVFFMRELMDEVRFSYKESSGNILTMVKKIPRNDAQ